MRKIKYSLDNTNADIVLKTALRVGFFNFNSLGKATLGRIEDEFGNELTYTIDESDKTATRFIGILKRWMRYNSATTVIFELHTRVGVRRMQVYIPAIIRENNIGVANQYEHLAKLPDHYKDLLVRSAEKYIYDNVSALLNDANTAVGVMIENGVDLLRTNDWSLTERDTMSGTKGFLSCYDSPQNIQYHVFKNMNFLAEQVSFQ